MISLLVNPQRWWMRPMKKNSLFDTNPYLRDPKKYRGALITNVSSSTAIETGASVESVRKQITHVSSGHPNPSPTNPESKPR